MDDKTEELRDIFLSVSEEETVTESQSEHRGTLATDGESVDERLRSAIEQLDAKFDGEFPFTLDERAQLVRGFYAGKDDQELADELACSPSTVFEARMGLHLIRDDDTPQDELASTVRSALDSDSSPAEIADEYEVAETTVRRLQSVVTAENRSRRVSHRFRTAFEEILTDADLTVQFAADAHADGLEEATEGAETDVEF